MPIKVLEEQVISRIAAGEVIERPASVVKELVENALDAGAGRIDVEVKGGGIELIRVTDDGSGIPSQELTLAFERHATSKINDFDDLQSIDSLGFRGEALPSIAAVSHVEIVSRAEIDPAGTVVELNNSVVVTRQSRAHARGTTVTVRDLFQRVPARLKFLKSVSTENGHIANAVSQYALAYPGVAFTLSVDGKAALKTSGKGRLLDAVIDVYGVETAGRMLPLDEAEDRWAGGEASGDIRVSGMVGSPDVHRSGRGYLSFFVNRRWVSSRLLSYAVEEAYHGLLMTGRHPVAVLNISLPPREVDVNIHPAKSEVKFRNESVVFRAVQSAVRHALVDRMPVPKIEDTAAPYRGSTPHRPELWSSDEAKKRREAPSTAEQPTLMQSLPVLRIIGQAMNAYIVAEGPDGLYIIDQHAAHERIRFDTLRAQRASHDVEVQGLLEPVTFEVAPRQHSVLESCLDELTSYGFSLEPFGGRAYLVRAVPVLIAGDGWPGMLRELLDELSGEAKSDWQERILESIACHGAVRSGQSLSQEEMRELVRQLEKTTSPYTCPHGRPTVIKLTAAQLERQFGRI